MLTILLFILLLVYVFVKTNPRQIFVQGRKYNLMLYLRQLKDIRIQYQKLDITNVSIDVIINRIQFLKQQINTETGILQQHINERSSLQDTDNRLFVTVLKKQKERFKRIERLLEQYNNFIISRESTHP